MKKLKTVFICFSTLILFSCASNKIPEDTNAEVPAIENIEIPENTIEESTASEEIQNNENSEEQLEIISEELEEIVEPIVIDLAPAEEDPVETENSSDENESEELIEVKDEISEDENNAEEKNNQQNIEETLEDSKETEETTAEASISKNSNDVESENKTDDNSETENPAEAEEKSETEATTNDQAENQSDSENQNEPETIDSEESYEYENKATPVKPSRSVTMKVTEYLDVTYPGKGWIYLGATDNSKNITYFGRRLGTEDTNFSLQARQPGTKILHFSKADAVSGLNLDDYLEVKVEAERGSSTTHVSAPEFQMPLKVKKPATRINSTNVQKTQPASKADSATANTANNSTAKTTPAKTGATTKTAGTTGSQQKTTSSTVKKPVSKNTKKSGPIDIDEIEDVSESDAYNETYSVHNQTSETNLSEEDLQALLENAKNDLNAKKFVSALNNITEYLEAASNNRDEGLYILGKILEEQSDVQDIAKAIEAYTTLTKNYSSSEFWDFANDRITYLTRHYLQGR